MLIFLDVLITRRSDNVLTLVYRKPTHTKRYIHFSSHHHPKTITGVLRCMKDQAHNICDLEFREQDLHHQKMSSRLMAFLPDL